MDRNSRIFITYTSKWRQSKNIIRQNSITNEWIRRGYITVNMDIPMTEYSFVSVSLTDLGQSMVDFNKL